MTECANASCHDHALWVPVLELRATPGGVAATAHIPELAVCQEHRDELQLEDLIGGDGWAQITRGFAAVGRAAPRRDLTVLTWQPLRFGGGAVPS